LTNFSNSICPLTWNLEEACLFGALITGIASLIEFCFKRLIWFITFGISLSFCCFCSDVSLDAFADEFDATDGTASFLTPSLFGVVGSFQSFFSEFFELLELFELLEESDGFAFVILLFINPFMFLVYFSNKKI